MAESECRVATKVRLDLAIDGAMGFIGASIMTTSAFWTASSSRSVLQAAASASIMLPDPPLRATTTSSPLSFRFRACARPLVAISDDGNALARERGGVDVGVTQQLHALSPSFPAIRASAASS